MSLLAKKFQQGSFRNVPFNLESTTFEGGRRVVVHEYPFKEINYSEDLGRRRREYSFEAFVNGENYESARDQLIAACENVDGEGLLVHPYFGTKKVVCTGMSVRESKSELGIAFFSLSFVEVGERLNPSSATDTASKLKSTVEELQSISSAAFEKIYSVANAPSFVTDSAEEKIQAFTDVVNAQAKKINGVTEKLADYTYQIRNMQADVRDIAQTPSRVAENFVTTLNNFLAILPGGSLQMKSALKGVSEYGVDFDTSNSLTSSRLAESENSRALRDLSFELVVGLLASEATDRTYSSYQDAETDRDQVLDLIDTILNRTLDDDVYLGFYRLKHEVVKAIPNPDKDLPRIVTVEFTAQLPSLVLAYDLYEELSLESDLIKRNGVANPGFMPANKEIKALRFS